MRAAYLHEAVQDIGREPRDAALGREQRAAEGALVAGLVERLQKQVLGALVRDLHVLPHLLQLEAEEKDTVS